MDDIYRDWASVAIDEDSEDEDSVVYSPEDSGLPDSDNEGSGAEQLGASLSGMSISPVRGTNITS